MIASIGLLLSPLFSDEDGRPRELIGHGALQAENKLSGAGCQERRTVRTCGGTLPLRKHNVSSCTWLKINPQALTVCPEPGLREEAGAFNTEVACQELVCSNKAINRCLFVSLSKTRWQRTSEKIALSVLLLYEGHSCTEVMRDSQDVV